MASSPHTTKQWVLAHKPTHLPILTGPNATFHLQTTTLPPLQQGQILARTRYFSNDTGLRNFIHPGATSARLYVNPVALGEPMQGGCLCQVLESAAPAFKPGDLVLCVLASWAELLVLDAASPMLQGPLPPLPAHLPPTHFLGAFGSSGLAAYTGLYFAGEAKPGQTIVISAAAGATGSMAVQIALRMVGAGRVVGIAGSDEKCAWVRDYLGAHACVNYKSATFLEDLAAATPGAEVDLYLDAVGGEVLDAVLGRMKRGGTVAVTGAICTYNSADEPMGLRNWFQIVAMSLTVRGYTFLNWMDKVGAITEELIQAAAEGKIRLDEGETLVEAPIERQPEIWTSLFSGANKGKLVTKLME
ncbi:NAD(P)-binding protein [Cryphonectria parasitica EP155]|uniref:Dehydrogenase FUB6 n=1 Tax=Cryphonectria parasitica (strain ATCC 38755 / EP155) TaxID=660469 RepID=A0A9P4YA11_CRYP1|nr:NAD(P)-binding protein [Cryphonectria parasitica EP155]KAF3769531.1 NAD(P)-binding protein [Cryphonectria parasitica EP155]